MHRPRPGLPAARVSWGCLLAGTGGLAGGCVSPVLASCPASCWHCPAQALPALLPALPCLTAPPAGAKVVARLAFAKIKSLHGALAEYRQAVEAKSAAVAGLQQAIAGLEEAARQRDAAVEEAEAKLAQVGGWAGAGAGGSCRA